MLEAKALRAKIDLKSAISLQRGQFDPNFQVQGVDPINHFFARIVSAMNALQLFAKSFTQRNFVGPSRLSSREVCFYAKTAVLRC